MSGSDASRIEPASPEFRAEVSRLEPWWFTFELAGHSFGGAVPRDVDKVNTFFEWVDRCRGSAESILELGSHEGSHTLQLAAHPAVDRVVGFEGRADNVERARFVQRAFGVTNVEFRKRNLERFDPANEGSFDAVFCAGLLYHLPEPWAFLERVSSIGRYLFLDTHYAASSDATVDRYEGTWYVEGDDPLSGLSERSFWLSFKHLMMALLETGLVVRFVRDFDYTPNGPRVWVFAERVDNGSAGCVWSVPEAENSLTLGGSGQQDSAGLIRPASDGVSPRRGWSRLRHLFRPFQT